MKKHLKTFKNTFYSKLYISYIAVALIPLIIFSSIFIQIVKKSQKNVLISQQELLVQFKLLFEQQLNDLSTIPVLLSKSPEIRELFMDLKKPTINDVCLAQKELKKYMESNSLIANIYLYNDVSKDLTSISNLSNVQSMPKEYASSPMNSVINSINLLKKGEKGYNIVKTNNSFGNKFTYIVYSYRLPYSIDKNNNSAIFLIVDLGSLQQKFSSAINSNYNDMFIINEQDIIFSISNKKTPFTIKYNDIMENTIIDINDKSYYCMKSQSDRFKWCYTYIFGNELIVDKTKNFVFLFIICIICSSLLAILLSWYLSNKNYKPINHLKNILKVEPSDKLKNENDFSLIIDKINGLKTKYELSEAELSKQEKIIKDINLTQILEGKVEIKQLEKLCVSNGFIFENVSYMVILLSIADNSPTLNQNLNNLVYSLSTKVLENKHVNNYTTEMKPNVFAIVLTLDIEQDQSILVNIVTNIYKLIISNINEKIYMVYSDIYTNIADINMSYMQAKNTLEYCKLSNFDTCLKHYDMQKQIDLDLLQHMIQLQNHFNNLMKAEDYKGARLCFEKINESLLNENNVKSMSIYNYSLFGIINIFLSSIEQLSLIIDKNTINDFVYRLIKSDSFMKLNEVATQLFNLIEQDFESNSKNNSEMVIEKTKKYIEDNYNDPNLSVTIVADYSNINPCYLSQLFKKYEGKTTADYIHLVRMEKAKELLKTEKIKDVAIAVGYQDVRSLIRVFKKYEGITPGKYKEINT